MVFVSLFLQQLQFGLPFFPSHYLMYEPFKSPAACVHKIGLPLDEIMSNSAYK